MNRPLAKVVLAVVGAFGVLLTAAGEETNSTAGTYMLSTTAPSYFYANSGIAATYYKYDTNGTFVLILKEHLGVRPVYGGRWVQASNGIVTMTATNLPAGEQLIETVVPMSYKQRVFLVWPGKDYKADPERVCRGIDSGTNERAIHNEFMISAEEFTKGTGKPYGFKFYQEMNQTTGADK